MIIDNSVVKIEHTFTRSKFSDVTENLPLICTRLALDLSSKESLNPTRSDGNQIKLRIKMVWFTS